jgi:hypothetical protein
MIDWAVFRQVPPDSSCADLWDSVYVNVTAETAQEACEATAIDKGGEGRYFAFPNDLFVGYNVRIKRIAEVMSERQEMV